MIHSRILRRIAHRPLRISGEQHRPQLRPDRAAHAIGKRIIIKAAKGGGEPPPHIRQRISVFIKGEPDMLRPFLRQLPGGHPHAPLLQGVQVDQLQIQVVIGQRPIADIRQIGEVQNLHPPLHRTADRPADILTDPAGENFVV